MILAVDIGTTFLKVGIIDFNGKISYSEKRAIDLSVDKDLREVDPTKWVKGLSNLFLSIPANLLDSLTGIVISGNGPTFVPVDKTGNSAGKALLWIDDRSLTVADEITRRLGSPIPPNFFLSKAFWFKKERPTEYKNTISFLSCPEYISYLLTGEKYTLLPQDGFIDLYWTDDKIDKLDLDQKMFPKFISPFEVYGTLRDNPITSGLRKGLPVICGGPDFIMSILGTGSVYEGVLCDRTGTSEGLNFCCSDPTRIEGLRTLPHVIPGLYTIAGLIPNSGEYLLNDRLDLLIDEYKNSINLMVKSGLKIKEIRVVGGHAGIERLNIKKASQFDIPLKVYPEGSDLVGNGVLGSLVLGVYPSIGEACSRMVKEKVCYN
ncbi:hypothetical protein EW093_10010 [Thiospirochaeta perfilievii]|uniref:Carbohydrate kinase FGGY N-terminal domain-containing protein n=1 Tax=Thiospirochaeta perfilievii TaxID=252967 RepID=A0A5C1QD85_9SPIO|nr:FGGY family carbohydrate kinase [Thiospirochaeta perfilievii]QEN05030.1 hypothetical protein EW093_10010 [Thiospirochaeta perfilievii]